MKRDYTKVAADAAQLVIVAQKLDLMNVGAQEAARIALVKQAHELGMPVTEIAERLGVSRPTVYCWFKLTS